ncbi:MAG: hypothetical protein ACP5I4_11530 [Oceanipulchritudo sp.]
MNRLVQAAGWFAFWLLLVAGITLAGAILGAVLFPVAGLLLGMDLEVPRMARNGWFDGGFLALIWAPGISFVACLMRAHRRYRESG